MGNRGVITTRKKDLGVYLHWNGGRDSVQAFLKYCELRNFRPPEEDGYGWARLCQVIGNYFGGSLSLGLDVFENLDYDNGDNGAHIIEDWKIVGREFFSGPEQDRYHLLDLLQAINAKQPKEDQLSYDSLKAAITSAKAPGNEKKTRAACRRIGVLP